ncbi:tRNA pseudouridine(13) synthase TruD [Halomonadaceae bacterium KBTZ08]
MTDWSLEWPRAGGEAVGSGRIRVAPEDFEVTESLGWQPDGEGEHLFVQLEKCGDNTDWVARGLARLAGCPAGAVGYAGRKDRHAVTRQWFSLPCAPARTDAVLQSIVGQWRILSTERHRRKLRTGELAGNRFRLRVRDLEADESVLASRWQALARNGCPNYFGSQRFGRDGGNLQAAAELDPERLKRPRERARSGMLLSAARSWLFNEWLARRLCAGDWREQWEGDPESWPSGPLYGDDCCGAQGPLAEAELAFAAQHPAFMALLRATRMRADRRSLVLKPLDCALEQTGDSAVFDFFLPAGAFATVVINEILDLEDGSRTP